MQFLYLPLLLISLSSLVGAAPTSDISTIVVEKRQGDVAWLIKHCLDERGGSAKMWDCSKSKVRARDIFLNLCTADVNECTVHVRQFRDVLGRLQLQSQNLVSTHISSDVFERGPARTVKYTKQISQELRQDDQSHSSSHPFPDFQLPFDPSATSLITSHHP
jgi:hypothetical protein